MGRPSLYTPELAAEIAERLETTPLKHICAEEGMPDRSVIHRWYREHPDFAAQCAQARARQVDVLVEEMADLEERVLSGELEPAAARVVLESQRWRAIKVAPLVYGDKVDHTHSAPGGGPIQSHVTISPQEAYQRMANGG